MIEFIKEHPGAIMQLLAILGGAVTALSSGIFFIMGWLLRNKGKEIKDSIEDQKKWFKETIGELEGTIQKYIEMQSACQKSLPDRFVSKHEFEVLFSKIDSILDRMTNIPLVYRTKDDANKDWRLLENRLAEIQATITSIGATQKDRHTEIWDKLNRVVDEFRSSRNMVMERQGKIEEIIFTAKEKFELAKKLREVEENNKVIE